MCLYAQANVLAGHFCLCGPAKITLAYCAPQCALKVFGADSKI